MIFFYFLALILSLFILFVVARHDFVLIRQNISLRQIFDNAFIILFIFFIVGRLGYVLYSLNFHLLSLFRFFYLTKYWGFMPFIGMIGVVSSLFILFRNKKNKLRVLDLYLLSYVPFIIVDVISQKGNSISFFIKIIALLVLGCFYFWFLKVHNKFSIKDGFISILISLTYSLVLLAFLFTTGVFTKINMWFELLLIAVIIFSLVFLFIIHKNLFAKK